MKPYRYYLHRLNYGLLIILCGVPIGMALGAQNSVVVWGKDSVRNVPPDVTNVATVATAYDYCVALMRDGHLRKWGYGSTNLPAVATNVAALSAAGSRLVALRRDGVVVDSEGVSRASNAVAVAAAESYGAGALRNDGMFVSWDGLLAPASNTSNVVALAQGGYATLRVLFSDGTISPNPSGLSSPPTDIVSMANGTYPVFLRSDGTVISSDSQKDVLACLSNVVAVASGYAHGLALKGDGSVTVWGGTSHGETNLPAGLSNVVAIAAGSSHSLALRADGTVLAWGDNSSGQATVPPGLTNVAAIFAGPNYSVAIVGDSPPVILMQPCDEAVWSGRPAMLTVRASGGLPLRFQWQMNGENIEGATNSVYQLHSAGPADSGFYSVVLRNARGTAISRDVRLQVWPDPYFDCQPTNQTALLGMDVILRTSARGSGPVNYQWFFEGEVLPAATNSDLRLMNLSLDQTGHYWVTASNVSGVRTSAVVTLSPRLLATWGSRYGGVDEIPDNLRSVAAIAAGGGNSFVLNPDGTGLFWGADDYVWPGMQISGYLSNVVAFAPGYQFILALLRDGTVVGRGLANDYGQIRIPPGLSNVVAVAAGDVHSLALRADGSVTAWGADYYGQAHVPLGLSNVVAIAAGGYHSLALRADGTVVAWGYNEFGQTNVPAGLSNVVAVAGGGHHSLALCGNGRVVAWGLDSHGQTEVPAGLEQVVAIAAGFYYSLALRSDGTVVGWGETSVPPNLRNVVAIAAGHSHALALRAEGLVVPPLRLANAGRAGSTFSLQTPTLRGRSYYLQVCDAVASSQWIMRPPIPGDGTLRTFVDPNATGPQRLYRIWQKP